MKKISSFILSIILILSNLLIVNMLIAPIGINNAVAFPGGNGTPGNPYQIANVTHLQNMSSNLSAHYILINDIDCTVTSGWNFGAGFIPIGDVSTQFTGTLDGQGFKIINLTVNRPSTLFQGLIGYANSNARIENVHMVGASVIGDAYVGVLIGRLDVGNVTNCTTQGAVTSSGFHSGGLIGHCNGIIINSTANCTTTGGGWNTGGLIATSQEDSLVIDCRALGYTIGTDISNNNDFVGGLIGYNYGTVRNCIAYGDVTASDDFAGGLIGRNYGAVYDSTAYGDADADVYVGGLIGSSSYKVINCTAFGNASGSNSVGGLIGSHNWIYVWNSTSYGNVSATAAYAGGLIGYSSYNVKNCSSYGKVDGFSYVGGLAGYQSNIGKIENCSSSSEVIASNSYVGGLLGYLDGVPISNCTVDGSIYGDIDHVGGLIGWNEGGTVTNCTVIADTNSSGNNVGGLVGQNNAGSITECTVYGNTSGSGASSENVGGLVGYMLGSVSNCHVYGNTQANLEYIGGLIGYNDGTVSNCTVTGDTFGAGATSNNVGGLIGYNSAAITNCTVNGATNGSGSDVGGLIGDNDGDIDNCSVWGNVYGYGDFIGGFIGYNAAGAITDCFAYGNLYGNGSDTEDSGGFIGWNQGGPILNCVKYGYTTAIDWDLGGFIGVNSAGLISNCTVYGDIDGWRLVGGLIGQMNGGSVVDCVVYGNVTGTNEYLGGLIGYIDAGSVSDCIAYGSVTGTGFPGDYVGGLIGQISGSIPVTNCTAYGDATGNKTWVGGLIGENWNGLITDCTAYGNATGPMDEVGGLIGESSIAGSVINCTAYGNAYGDNDVGGLIGMSFGLVSNCIAYGDATGTADGVGGLIGWNYGDVDNCTSYGDANGIGVDSGEIGGLMGYNDVKKVENCVSYGSAATLTEHIGGLIGENKGPVTKCIAYGSATGATDWIGGLIGLNDGGTITICVALGDAIGNATGHDYVGGLIGDNSGGSVENCFSHGNATGNVSVGGLIGYNDGPVNASYSIGFVIGDTNVGGLIGNNASSGSVTNCFWDNITSGMTTSAGGAGTVGVNTTLMQKEATFTSASWNFTGIWAIIDGKTYPYFGNFYNPPQITTSDATIAIEDVLYWVDYEVYFPAYPPNNYVDTWTLSTNSSGWLSIDSNGILSGTPTNDDLGAFWVNVTMTDIYGGTDSHNFTLTVLNVNSPPMITTPNNTTAIEDLFYNVDYDAIDPDPTGDLVFWNYTTNATWLNFNKLTGVLSGMPLNAHVGSYWVNITATDDKGGESSTNFTLTVLNVNNPPMITTPNNTTAIEDIFYTVDYDATDPDPTGDSIFWNYITNATWLIFNQLTGVLFGWPVNSDVGSYWVNITATDGKGGESSTNFTLTVINVNGEPLITTLDVLTAYEDALYSVDYNATDEESDTLAWSMTTNSTSYWLGIDTVTGVLSGIPDNNDVGEIWVNITVDDGNGGIDYVNFTLTIVNTNDDPMITTTDQLTATEDLLYSVDYEVSDEDINNVHTWFLSTDATWLNIDDSTGVLSGVPTNADVGSYWVKVTVDDYHGGTESHNFTLTVLNTNDAPSITTTDVGTAIEDDLYSVQYNASDIDPTNDVFTWTITTDAGWLSIGASSGILSGTPDNGDVGEYFVNITVDDGNNGSDMHIFTLTVSNVNDDPVITTTDVTTAIAGELYSVDYNATDIDPTNDVFTWSKTGAGWLSIDPSTGLLSGTPSNDNEGTYSIDVTVIDGNGGSDVSTFILTVEPGVVITNLNPEITTTDLTTVTAGELYTQTYDATDDRTLPANLTWTMSTNAGWLDFDASTRVLSGTPAETDVGIYWVLITVNDGEGGSDSNSFNITVDTAIVNTQPVLTSGQISPTTGDTDTSFTFTVHYQDADGDAPESVNVMIDGEMHEMALESGDSSDGTYSYTTKLSEGTHSYYFTANDGTDNAVSGDNTPTNYPDAESTSSIEEPEEEGVTDWTFYLILIIIIIIIISIIAFAMSRRGGAPLTEESFFIDEEEEMAAEDMASEEDLDEDVAVDEAKIETAEYEEEVEGFECPTCGAELSESETKCLECGEEFDDE